MSKIRLTDFCVDQHFDSRKRGTTILDRQADQFQHELNERVSSVDPLTARETVKRMPGYAPFCQLLFLENWTDAVVGTMKITPENENLLRSGYHARREGELPVLTRWFEATTRTVRNAECTAKYLCIVLYNSEQMKKEDKDWNDAWGVVAILGQSHCEEEPMTPITAMRNALGIEEGGSGVAVDRGDYERSVKFWQENAVIGQP